jgi:hypothetical protein
MTILPNCAPCCNTIGGDQCCPTGILPESVTVTFEGNQGTQVEGPNLLYLNFSSCFGSKAEGVATGPGGDDPPGPISDATITNPGSGYAVLGRVEPTITLANQGDVEADVTVVLAEQKDDCGLSYWSITGLMIADGGSGYVDNEIQISIGVGDTVEIGAIGNITTKTSIPTLVASTQNGTGGEFSVSIVSNGDDPETWSIDSVLVTGTMSGYIDGELVTFSGQNLVFDEPPEVSIVTGHLEPEVEILVLFSDAGSGANITASIVSNGDTPETWSIDSVTILDGGTGYEPADFIVGRAVGPDGITLQAFRANPDIDQNGSIVGMFIDWYGVFYKSDEVVSDIIISNPGRFYKGGVLSGLSLTSGGRYYRQDASVAPYVASIDVSVDQLWYDDGFGAVIEASVNSDTSSPTFGQITSLTVVNGGDGYIGWIWLYSCDCDWVWGENAGTDYSITAYRQQDIETGNKSCTYLGYRCFVEGGALPWSQTFSTPLVALELSSALTDMIRIPFSAFSSTPAGWPGRHNGPLNIQEYDGFYYIAEGVRWAVPGRVEVIPNRVSPGGAPASCTMAQGNFGILPYWYLTSATASNNDRQEPTLTAKLSVIAGDSPFSGSGALLEVSLLQNSNSWEVGSVSVISTGGGNYPDTVRVTFLTDSKDITLRSAVAIAFARREQPTFTATIASVAGNVSNGVGAEFSLSIQENVDLLGRSIWSVTNLNVEAAGSGYGVNDPIAINSDGKRIGIITAKVGSVTSSGGISSVIISNNSAYFYKNNGIENVVVSDGGSYFRPQYYNGQPVTLYYEVVGCDSDFISCLDLIGFPGGEFDVGDRRNPTGTCIVNNEGVLTGINIVDPGILYRQVHSDEEPAIAPEITANIIQNFPSEGYDAVISATINTDTRDNNFGSISALTIENSGDGYLLYTIGGSLTSVLVDVGNSTTPPSVTIACGGNFGAPGIGGFTPITYTADEPLINCDEPNFTATFGKSNISVKSDDPPPKFFPNRSEPVVYVTPGSFPVEGAKLEASLIETENGMWAVEEVTVVDPGKTNVDPGLESLNIPLTFSVMWQDQVRKTAVATAKMRRAEPELPVFFNTGCQILPVFTQTTDQNGKNIWVINSFQIIHSEPIAIYTPFFISNTPPQSGQIIVAISDQDEDGYVTGVSIGFNTAVYYDLVIDDSVTITNSGEYFRPDEPFRGRSKCCNICDTCCPDSIEQLVISIIRDSSEGNAIKAADHTVDSIPAIRGHVQGPMGAPAVDVLLGGDTANVQCPSDESEIIIDIQDLILSGPEAPFAPFCHTLTWQRSIANALDTSDSPSLIAGVIEDVRVTISMDLFPLGLGCNPSISITNSWNGQITSQQSFTLKNFTDQGNIVRSNCAFPGDGWTTDTQNNTSETPYCLLQPIFFGDIGAALPPDIERSIAACSECSSACATANLPVYGLPKVGQNYIRSLNYNPGPRWLCYPRRICNDYQVEIQIQ